MAMGCNLQWGFLRGSFLQFTAKLWRRKLGKRRPKDRVQSALRWDAPRHAVPGAHLFRFGKHEGFRHLTRRPSCKVARPWQRTLPIRNPRTPK